MPRNGNYCRLGVTFRKPPDTSPHPTPHWDSFRIHGKLSLQLRFAKLRNNICNYHDASALRDVASALIVR